MEIHLVCLKHVLTNYFIDDFMPYQVGIHDKSEHEEV